MKIHLNFGKQFMTIILILSYTNIFAQIKEINTGKELDDIFYYFGDLVMVFDNEIRIYDHKNFDLIVSIDCKCSFREKVKISRFRDDFGEFAITYRCVEKDRPQSYFSYKSKEDEKHESIPKSFLKKHKTPHRFNHPILQHKIEKVYFPKNEEDSIEEQTFYFIAGNKTLKILKYTNQIKEKFYNMAPDLGSSHNCCPSGEIKTFDEKFDKNLNEAHVINSHSFTNEKIYSMVLCRSHHHGDLLVVALESKVIVFSVSQLIDETRTNAIKNDKSDSKIFALSIGLGVYKNSERLGSLPSVVKYVNDFNWHLTNKGFLDNESNPVLINSQASRKAIMESLRKNFVDNLDVTANDFVIFYFSGHGVLAGDNLGICPYDFYNLKDVITQNEIISIMEECRARHKLVIIEACKTELTADIIPQELKASFNSKRNMHVDGLFYLTSTKKGQYSLVNPKIGPVFSHFLIKGVSEGKANLNHDNYISIGELTDYLRQEVSNYTNGDQVPELIKNEIDLNTPIFIDD